MNEYLTAFTNLFGAIVNSYEYMLNTLYYINILGYNLGDILIFLGLLGILFALFLGGDDDD